MASYSTNEFRGDLKIMLDGDPYVIVENEFVKPGKGQAFNRVKVRNLKTGRVVEKTFKSGESVEAADVHDTQMQYLYHDGELWYFIEPPNFVVLEITETDPGVRGDTSGGGGKPATLETGAVVRVPLFVQTGELIKVDTRSGTYVSRAREE